MSALLTCQSKIKLEGMGSAATNGGRAEGRVKEEERLDSPGPCSKTKGFEEARKRLSNY